MTEEIERRIYTCVCVVEIGSKSDKKEKRVEREEEKRRRMRTWSIVTLGFDPLDVPICAYVPLSLSFSLQAFSFSKLAKVSV